MKEKKEANLKTELGHLYLTSDDKKFLSVEEALLNELEIIKDKENKRKVSQMDTNTYNLVAKILAKNDWGLYFKAEPLQSLPIQDGCKMFKINDVNLDTLHEAILREIENERQLEEWEKNNTSQNSENSTE